MPGRKTEAERWIRQASYDLRAARWNIEGKFYDTACFLAQQAAEKAMKSLLYYLGARRAALLTHSLVEMVQEASGRVSGLAERLDDARDLDLHYIPSRYPNGLPGASYPHQFYAKQPADRAVAAAERIIGLVSDFYRARAEERLLLED
jgi:HEPN domain-containing protein